MGPLPNGRTSWLINGGDPNHLRVLGWSSKYPNLNHQKNATSPRIGIPASNPRCLGVERKTSPKSRLFVAMFLFLDAVKKVGTLEEKQVCFFCEGMDDVTLLKVGVSFWGDMSIKKSQVLFFKFMRCWLWHFNFSNFFWELLASKKQLLLVEMHMGN